MMSKTLAFGLLAAGCVVAAAGSAYIAVRQNSAVQPAAVAAPAATATAPTPGTPVADTEAVVAARPPDPEPQLEPAPARQAEPVRSRREPARPQRTATAPPPRRAEPPVQAPPVTAPPERAATVEPPVQPPPTPVEPPVEPPRPYEPPPPPEPQFEEVIVPASSVIGLQVTTALSSERAQVEDRVEARVTRDVIAAGRVAIPAGSRVIGSVTLVERGGKVKERARLGVRFHTLVLADGSEQSLRTDGIFREGESPTGESARKIGGAAIGGAILGAILGGGKGAATGGAIGAAGGTAAVMAGDRNAATLPSGTIVTVRLTAPLAVELRKDK